MSLIQPGGLAVAHFNTSVGGISTSADQSVSAVVFRNQLATSIVPIVTTVAVGHYAVSFVVPANWTGYDRAFIAFTTEHMSEFNTCTKEAGVIAAAGLDDNQELNIDRILDLMEADQVKIDRQIFYYLRGSNQTALLHTQDITGSTCVDDVSLISP